MTDITPNVVFNTGAIVVEGHAMISAEHFSAVITSPWKIFAFSAIRK
jgi:hypothetical protein